MRYILAIWLGKLVKMLLLAMGRGGTTLPGLVMIKIYPRVLDRLSAELKHGSVVVTGTNGKTTTSRLISAMLSRHGYVVLSNRSGSNLERGVVASFIDHLDWRGRGEIDVAVLEIDEADLVNIAGKVACRELVVTNLFRDQLDRYGELMSLRDIVKKSLEEMAAGSRVVLNADDPLVRSLADYVPEGVEVRFYGMSYDSEQEMNFAIDVNKCVICGGELKYQNVYLSHLGDYRCTKCGFGRPDLDVSIAGVSMKGVKGTSILMENSLWGQVKMDTNFPGVYNLYNVAAAICAVLYFEVEIDVIIDVFRQMKSAFGRFEEIEYEGRKLYLMLSKNPTGFNEMLKTVLMTDGPVNLIFILNDNYADGRDVSWIWDVDFEKLSGRVNWLGLSGIRANDMMLRVKYAGLDLNRVGIVQDYQQLADDIIDAGDERPVYVMATYTGMLEFRSQLQKRGVVAGFWED